MAIAHPFQKMQDWLTQEWVIVTGRKINPSEASWLLGPFGSTQLTGTDFIAQLAAKENLIIQRETRQALVSSIKRLVLSEQDRSRLSPPVVDFYENTSSYDLEFAVTWNPFFRGFGFLISRLFSSRLRQLNIPIRKSNEFHSLRSELIALATPDSADVKYTFWLRSIRSTGQPVYSGIYGLGALPSGQSCIKAVFPLPNGNATVLMTPTVGDNGELILDAAGNRFGEAGFYFLLKDFKGNHWAKYVKSFRDRLIVTSTDGALKANQVLTLWNQKVLQFDYEIRKASTLPSSLHNTSH